MGEGDGKTENSCGPLCEGALGSNQRAMLYTVRDRILLHRAVFYCLELARFEGSCGWMCLHVITLHFWTFSRRVWRLEGLVLQLLPRRV